ncbi:MAG: GxxExxY protein [Gemmatimonadaceae bacterium]
MYEHQDLSSAAIAAAIRVHQRFGPGLLESAYDECLALQLTRWNLCVQRQVAVPIEFEDHRIEAAYRIDLLVEGVLILEVKAVERLLTVHMAQLRTYLRLSGHRNGLLLNFCVPTMKEGIRRISI